MLGGRCCRWACHAVHHARKSLAHPGIAPDRLKDVAVQIRLQALGVRSLCFLTARPEPHTSGCVRSVSSNNTLDKTDPDQDKPKDSHKHSNLNTPQDVRLPEDGGVEKRSHLSETVTDWDDSREFQLAVSSFEKSIGSETTGPVTVQGKGAVTPAEEGEITDTQLERLPPKRVVRPVYNLAALVNKSDTLSNLLKLGVDLSAVEKDREAGNLFIQLDFEKDVQPVLFFLHDIGVTGLDLGPLLTRYPMILQRSLRDLRNHLNYLKSKKFSQEAVTRIVVKNPKMFSKPVEEIDRALGIYQRAFKLTGDEVRTVVTRLPKLITWDSSKVKEVKFYMHEFLGFSHTELKTIFMSTPKVLLSDRHQLGKRFDLLYNEMKLTHTALVTWPQVFRTRLHLMRDRHLFLKHLGRAQYDPQRENYVSMRALVSGKDRDFCFHVAKSSVAQFNDFLKTL